MQKSHEKVYVEGRRGRQRTKYKKGLDLENPFLSAAKVSFQNSVNSQALRNSMELQRQQGEGSGCFHTDEKGEY